MKPIDLNSSTYIDFDVANNIKDNKFVVGNQVKVSKYKIPWIYVIKYLNDEDFFGACYKREL